MVCPFLKILPVNLTGGQMSFERSLTQSTPYNPHGTHHGQLIPEYVTCTLGPMSPPGQKSFICEHCLDLIEKSERG